jgi:hypothetical protein
MNAVQGLNDAMVVFQDIRRLHRLKAWPVLPDRYTSLRKELIAIRGRTPGLSEAQQAELQGAVQQLSILESEAEKAIEGSELPKIHSMNEVVSKQIDRLAILLTELQKQMDE